MAVRAISRMGHPVLRQPARELKRGELLSPPIQQLIQDMLETMHDAEGVGLAAPQVYEGIRLLVAEAPSGRPKSEGEATRTVVALANPEIVSASQEMEDGWEGCLSIPEIRGIVPRHRAITVRGLNPQGRALTVEAEGYFARILQHEIDHLDGILFLDRMKDFKTLTYLKEFERYWMEPEDGD
jgi:peptide deformylase